MEKKEPSDSAYGSVSRSNRSGSSSKSQHGGSNTSNETQSNATTGAMESKESLKTKKTKKNSRKRNYSCLVFPEDLKAPLPSYGPSNKQAAPAGPSVFSAVPGVSSIQSTSDKSGVRKRHASSSLGASSEQRVLQTAAITRVLDYLESGQHRKGSERSDPKEGSRAFSFKSILSDPAASFYKESFAYLNDLPTVKSKESFAAAISLQDGVVAFVTTSLTDKLGFPTDMWLGRFLLDFLHPKDRLTFTNQTTASLLSGLNKEEDPGVTRQRVFTCSTKTICCRFRRYRGLATTGFGIVEKKTSYLPFVVKLSMERIAIPGKDEETGLKEKDDEENYEFYLIAEATLVTSAFTQPKEKPVAAEFNLRHTANCQFSQVDPESVPYLGHLPQDLMGASVFDFYHPDDLPYLKDVYSKVMSRQGRLVRSKPYSFRIYNGCYILLETDWTCFVNPWTRKVEFVAGQHRILEGPSNPDVFANPQPDNGQSQGKSTPTVNLKKIQEEIRSALTGSSRSAFHQGCTKTDLELKGAISKRRKELALLMGSILEEMTRDRECGCGCSRSVSRSPGINSSSGSVLAGISSHHGKNRFDGSSSGSPVSYSQLNYNENLERYFHSQPKMEPSEGSRDGMQIILGSGGSGSDQDRNPTSSSGGSTELQNLSMSQSGSNSQTDTSGESKIATLTERALTKHNQLAEEEFKKTYKGRKGCNYAQKRPCQQGVKRGVEASWEDGSRGKYAFKADPQPPAGAEFPPTPHVPPTEGRASLGAVYEGSTTTGATIFPINLSPPFSLTHVGASLPGTILYSFPPLNRSGASAPVTTVTVTNSVPSSIPTYYLTPAVGSTAALSMGNHMLSCYPFHRFGQGIVYQPTLAMQPTLLAGSNQNAQTLQQRTRVSTEDGSRLNGARDEGSISTRNNGGKIKRNDAGFHSTVPESSRSGSSGSQSSVVQQESIFSLASTYSQTSSSHTTSGEYLNFAPPRVYAPMPVPRKRNTPPWMETVNDTREFAYQYQLPKKGLSQTLSEDRARLEQLHQPSLLNEQLEQLYREMDEGTVKRNLGWDETETTASSSSGAEEIQNTCINSAFMKSVIYEENAPIACPPVLATLPAENSL